MVVNGFESTLYVIPFWLLLLMLAAGVQFLGEYIKETGTSPVVATKFAPLPWRFNADSVVCAAKDSLKRLQLEKMGLYMIHWCAAPQLPAPSAAVMLPCCPADLAPPASGRALGSTAGPTTPSWRGWRSASSRGCARRSACPTSTRSVWPALLTSWSAAAWCWPPTR